MGEGAFAPRCRCTATLRLIDFADNLRLAEACDGRTQVLFSMARLMELLNKLTSVASTGHTVAGVCCEYRGNGRGTYGGEASEGPGHVCPHHRTEAGGEYLGAHGVLLRLLSELLAVFGAGRFLPPGE